MAGTVVVGAAAAPVEPASVVGADAAPGPGESPDRASATTPATTRAPSAAARTPIARPRRRRLGGSPPAGAVTTRVRASSVDVVAPVEAVDAARGCCGTGSP